MKIETRPLLSICIPTYNRCTFLQTSLERIFNEVIGFENELELLISDNHSSDETPKVVENMIQKGLALNYIRNESNLGPDLNFVQCFRKASGKYIWILGDDDFIKRGVLAEILKILRSNELGLLCIENSSNDEICFSKYDKVEDCLRHISYYITFISGHIVNSKSINLTCYEKYIGSFFIQIPFYVTAMLTVKTNAVLKLDAMDCAAASSSNGGFNFFQVYISNYLLIWKNYLEQGAISKKMYLYLKKDIFCNFHILYITNLLVRKNVGNFYIDKAWNIIFKNYGLKFYFYVCFAKLSIKVLKKAINFKHIHV